MLDLASPRVRAGALVVLGVGVAVIAYLLVGNDDTTAATPPTPPPAVVQPTVPAIPARLVTQDELKQEAAAQDHPIYWAGPRGGVCATS